MFFYSCDDTFVGEEMETDDAHPSERAAAHNTDTNAAGANRAEWSS